MESRSVHGPEALSTTLNDYQTSAATFGDYPEDAWNTYLPLNLASEAGEAAGKFAKYFRGDGPLPVEGVLLELGDTLWFVAELSRRMGYTLSEVAAMNISKLESRKARGTMRGEGDYR